MKIEVMVLEILKKGPATTSEIAEELRRPKKNTSAYMCNLRKHGHVKAFGKVSGAKGRPPETIWQSA